MRKICSFFFSNWMLSACHFVSRRNKISYRKVAVR